MIAALRAELRKNLSTSMWWVLLLSLVGYLAMIAAAVAFSASVDDPEARSFNLLPPDEVARTVYSLTSAIGYVFPLVIGSLSVTGEFRHRTITSSLLVDPRRSVLLGAKLIASVPIGLAYGVLGTATVVGVGAPVLHWQGDGAFLDQGETLETIGLSVVVMVLWAVMGVAFGGVLTNQVAAIVVVLAFTQLVEPIARIGLSAWDATSGIAPYLPGAAADAVLGASFYTAMDGGGDLLSREAGVAVMLGYVVVLSLVARFTTFRRDVG